MAADSWINDINNLSIAISVDLNAECVCNRMRNRDKTRPTQNCDRTRMFKSRASIKLIWDWVMCSYVANHVYRIILAVLQFRLYGFYFWMCTDFHRKCGQTHTHNGAETMATHKCRKKASKQVSNIINFLCALITCFEISSHSTAFIPNNVNTIALRAHTHLVFW